jgi:hypothetical protein
LFGVRDLPSDNQIRSWLDATEPGLLDPMYSFLLDALEQAGALATYRSSEGARLLALDGTEHFSSRASHCEHCSTRRQANGQMTYFHTALTPVRVRPGVDQVLPWAPELVRPQDGTEKQDCELNAAQHSPGGGPRSDRYCHECQ